MALIADAVDRKTRHSTLRQRRRALDIDALVVNSSRVLRERERRVRRRRAKSRTTITRWKVQRIAVVAMMTTGSIGCSVVIVVSRSPWELHPHNSNNHFPRVAHSRVVTVCFLSLEQHQRQQQRHRHITLGRIYTLATPPPPPHRRVG
jgi:hypothetical protein